MGDFRTPDGVIVKGHSGGHCVPDGTQKRDEMNLALISFVVFTGAVAVVGFLSHRAGSREDSDDFLLAGRNLGPWLAALSASASAESGWVTLGLVGFAFTTGVAAFWIVPGTVAAFLVNWFAIAPRLNQLSRSGPSTIPEVLTYGFRDGRATTGIRLLSAVIILSMLTAYEAAQFNAAGRTMTGAFGSAHLWGVIAGAGIVMLYTMAGGFRAVAWTDAIQAGFMIATLVGVPWLLVSRIGGPEAMMDKLHEMDQSSAFLHPSGGRSGEASLLFFSLWLGIPLGNFGQPHVILRFMAARDGRAIRQAGIISSLWILVVFTSAVLLGISARAWFGSLESPENTLPILAAASDFIHPVFGGFIIGTIFAAICSTTDSQLLVSASTISHDLLKNQFGIRMDSTTLLRLTRVSILLLTLVAAAYAAAEVQSIFNFVLDYGWAGLGAGFGPPLLFRLFWRRTSAWGTFAGMLIGLITVMAWKNIPILDNSLYCLLPAMITASTALIMVSYIAPDRDEPEEHSA